MGGKYYRAVVGYCPFGQVSCGVLLRFGDGDHVVLPSAPHVTWSGRAKVVVMVFVGRTVRVGNGEVALLAGVLEIARLSVPAHARNVAQPALLGAIGAEN